jgi:phosphatidylserine/phosphatidylglycerophosphate/cardiolipin synthase-like enzyme
MSGMKVMFSPHGGVAVELASLIDAATTSIWVMAYEFTSVMLAESLLLAQRRGVDVEVLLDARASESHSSMRHYFQQIGVNVMLDRQHPIAHNKVMLIDGRYVVTGSYNFTEAAESHNAENCLVIDDVDTFNLFHCNYLTHLLHSTPAA